MTLRHNYAIICTSITVQRATMKKGITIMSIQKFEDGYVTIEFSPFQCANLARACYFASEESLDEYIEVWRTLADLFHACTIAGYAQWHMSNPDLEALLHQLNLLNLRRNDNDDDKSKLNGHKH